MSDARGGLSLIAHAALPMMGPLTRDDLLALLAPLAPTPGRDALDVGGGRADLAIVLHDRLGLRVTSVDRSRVVCDDGGRRIGVRAITIVESDASEHLASARPRDLALAACLGSTHALGGLAETVATLAPLLAPDGALIVGDLVRLADLDDEPFRDLPASSELDRALAARHLTERARVLVAPASLAAYERAWRDATEHHLARHPDDPAAEWARARNDAMRELERRGALDRVAYLAITATRGALR